MAGKTDYFENALLKLIFQAIPIAALADNAATAPATTLYLSLHTADPTDAATGQTTNECTYTNYIRIGLTRAGSHWTVTGNSVSPVSNVEFPACATGFVGTQIATHAGIGLSASGAGVLIYSGPISPSISIGAGVIPRLTPASAITED